MGVLHWTLGHPDIQRPGKKLANEAEEEAAHEKEGIRGH